MRARYFFASILLLGAAASSLHAQAIAGLSIYQLNSSWKTQSGAKLRLRDLRGKPRVIAMFYSHCPYMCPLVVSDMKRLQNSLAPEARKRVGFVLISIDPKRDSAPRLKHFASEQGLDSSTWTLLSGASEAVRDLAAALGFRYRESATGFAHSYLISAVDSAGIVRAQLTQAGSISPSLIRSINDMK